MSGIVGIVNWDGAPVDRELLEAMTGFMTYRGPDRQGTWIDGNVGLGHTLLRTTWESEHESQPFTLDRRTWIVADARIDGRDELIARLEPQVSRKLKDAPDVELILHSYNCWGEACIDSLIGDFAFAIWDAPRRKLFCARDHFGVKPFYYAKVGSCFVFSNTLNVVRRHPLVSDALNEAAIGDFLIFDYNANSATTTFADVQRIPPAHSLIVSDRGVMLNRYWTLPIGESIQYGKYSDYVENFTVLFRQSVWDRLRAPRVAVGMSGGVDSPAIAAAARQCSCSKGPLELRAFCAVFRELMPDREGHYAHLAATRLGLPIEYFDLDPYRPYQRWDDPDIGMPEPSADPFISIPRDLYAHMGRFSPVVLNGSGGDALLCPSRVYLPYLLKRMKLGALTGAFFHLWRRKGHFPRIGIRTLLRLRNRPVPLRIPDWLNPDLVEHLDLQARFERVMRTDESSHPLRPDCYESLSHPHWQSVFETQDPSTTGLAVEVRYPFLDTRLVDFMLRVPPLPWCSEKHILRTSMDGVLPGEILRRPKTYPTHDVLKLFWGDFETELGGLAFQRAATQLRHYVNYAKIPKRRDDATGLAFDARLWVDIRPICLARWLINAKLVN